MSNPYPPTPPKRLARSTSNRLIGGVCGGVAEYLNMDANLVRILTVLISLFTGVPVILYIIALFVMPEDTAVRPTAPPPVTGTPTYPGTYSATEAAAPAPAYTPYPGQAGVDAPRPTAEDAVWGTEGPPWEQRQPEPTPAADEPVATAGLAEDGTTPQPVAPSEPEAPVAPSEPEAPVVPPTENQPKTDDKPPS